MHREEHALLLVLGDLSVRAQIEQPTLNSAIYESSLVIDGLTQASSEPVAKASLLGWKRMAFTSPSCPEKLCTHCPLRMSHTSACLSAPLR